MFFNVHESRATIVGLDSSQYQQQRNPIPMTVDGELYGKADTDVEHEEINLEDNGVVTLVPSDDACNPTFSSDGSFPSNTSKLLSAMANMDDASSESPSERLQETTTPQTAENALLPSGVFERQPSSDLSSNVSALHTEAMFDYIIDI